MSEVAARYGTVAGAFEATMGRVRPEGWSSPSPCADWTARDVVVHVINTHRHVRGALGDLTVEEVDPKADLETGWASATSAIRDALRDRTLATANTTSGPFGEQPFEALVGDLLCADTLVHTWDLAKATDQDVRLDPEAIEKALAFLAPLDEKIRRPGGFGPKLDPPAGADDQTRLLAFTGRAP